MATTSAESRPLTFDELARLEPRLKDLELRAQRFQPTVCDECEVNIWYREIKPLLLRIVGYDRPIGTQRPADQELLMSSAAYECVSSHLLSQIPHGRGECQKCGKRAR